MSEKADRGISGHAANTGKGSKQTVSLILKHMAEKTAPSDEINLWPGLQARIQAGTSQSRKGAEMNARVTLPSRLRLVAFIMVALALNMLLVLATPQGRTWAQSIFYFFTRTQSDSLPVQPFQLTPIPATTAPDPGDIQNASLTVGQAEQLAGFDILEPAWLPASLSFVGATYDPEKHSTRLFYRYAETNGLVLREEPFQQADDCELCGKVGASAAIELVQIGGQAGEYVEGVWNLTENGPEWVSDPYLKTMRWQANGMAFELLYMGPPDSLTREDMVAIAESVK